MPFIYYGEELGLRGRKPDEEIRTPLPWNAVAPGYGFTTGEPWEALAPGAEDAAIAVQTDDTGSLLSHYRSLIRLRAAHPAVQSGLLIPVDEATSGIYAYLRHVDGETVAVVANLTDETLAQPALSLAAGPLCGTPTAELLLDGAGTNGSSGTAGAPAVAAPSVTPAGGFAAWVPVQQLAAHEAVVVRLSP